MSKLYLERSKGAEPSSFLVSSNSATNHQFLNLFFNETTEFTVTEPFTVNWAEFARDSRVVGIPGRGTELAFVNAFEELNNVGFKIKRGAQLIADSIFNFKTTPKSPVSRPTVTTSRINPIDAYIGTTPPTYNMTAFIKDNEERFTDVSPVQGGSGWENVPSVPLPNRAICVMLGFDMSQYDSDKNLAMLREVRRYDQAVRRVNLQGGQVTASVYPYQKYSVPDYPGKREVFLAVSNRLQSPNTNGDLSQDPSHTYQIWTMETTGGIDITGHFNFSVPTSGGYRFDHQSVLQLTESTTIVSVRNTRTLIGGALVKLVDGVPAFWTPLVGDNFNFDNPEQTFTLTIDPDRPISSLTETDGEHHVQGINQTTRPIIGYDIDFADWLGNSDYYGVQLRSDTGIIGISSYLGAVTNEVDSTPGLYYKEQISVLSANVPKDSVVYLGIDDGTNLTKVRSHTLTEQSNGHNFGDFIQNFVVSPTNVTVDKPVFSSLTSDSINTAVTVNNLTTTTQFLPGDVISVETDTADVQYVAKLSVVKA